MSFEFMKLKNVTLTYVFSSGLTISPSTISSTQDFTVTVTVRNSGSVDGKEVVQVFYFYLLIKIGLILFFKVYATDLVSSAVTPNQELVGFQKVDIPYVKRYKSLLRRTD